MANKKVNMEQVIEVQRAKSARKKEVKMAEVRLIKEFNRDGANLVRLFFIRYHGLILGLLRYCFTLSSIVWLLYYEINSNDLEGFGNKWIITPRKYGVSGFTIEKVSTGETCTIDP